MGDFIDFFEIEHERVYLWTPKKDEYSILVVGASEEVKDRKCWITLASLMELARCLWTSFERNLSDARISYQWVYYFDPYVDIENSTFYGMKMGGPNLLELMKFSSGIVLSALEIAEMAHIIEFLNRDEVAYTATAALQSSFSSHYCCLICETGSYAYHDHLAQEPELWEYVSEIPKMEIAIVQACRAVEAILGKPPSSEKSARVLDRKEKWRKLLGFDPDLTFEKAQISFFDFYYRLFDKLRNPSAHSYGKIHYDLLNRSKVEAQCFAAKILFEYIKTNAMDNTSACEKMLFNRELLSRVSKQMSTKRTKQ